MAGKKRKAVAEEPARPKAAATAAAAVAVQSSPRRTRSATARAASGQAEQKPEPIKKKPKPSKGKKSAAQDDPEPEKDEKDADPVAEDKTIIIEACKQCNSFKTRASQVKEGLEKGVPGVTVTINPEKPRKGCFEVRTGSGNTFISLLNMPRPFRKMKDLDMDEVIEDIVKKLNE